MLLKKFYPQRCYLTIFLSFKNMFLICSWANFFPDPNLFTFPAYALPEYLFLLGFHCFWLCLHLISKFWLQKYFYLLLLFLMLMQCFRFQKQISASWYIYLRYEFECDEIFFSDESDPRGDLPINMLTPSWQSLVYTS